MKYNITLFKEIKTRDFLRCVSINISCDTGLREYMGYRYKFDNRPHYYPNFFIWESMFFNEVIDEI